jgi:hypothetical protein
MAFAARTKTAGKCVKCGKPYASASWQSEFVSKAVKFHCGHSSTGSLCGVCEQDTLISITRMEEKCFVPGCQEILDVKPNVIETRLVDDYDIRVRQVISASRHLTDNGQQEQE